MGAHRLLSPPLLSPCLPDLSVMLVCSPVPTRNLQHTPTHTHPYSTHTPTHAHHDQYTRVYAVRADGAVHTHAPACAHMHTNAWAGAAPTHKLNAVCMHAETRTRSALRLAHIQACCGAHTPAQTHTVSLQWLPHGCTHTHKHSARGSRAHTHAHT